MRHFEVWPAQSYSGKHFICREFAADKCKSDKATEFQACRRCCKISWMSPFVKSPPSFKRKVTSKTYFEIMCHSEIWLHAISPYILLETTSSSWLFRNPLCNMKTWESWTSLSPRSDGNTSEWILHTIVKFEISYGIFASCCPISFVFLNMTSI